MGRLLPLCQWRPLLRQHGCAGFSKIASSYLLHIGSLDWTKINPDIFGSMIQAVADEEERGGLDLYKSLTRCTPTCGKRTRNDERRDASTSAAV